MLKKISSESYRTTNWSGGTTTELFIFPENSVYSERNFLFRISSADIKIAKSTFTKLPNISRKIMVLEGSLELNHKNHHQKNLKEFDQDSFSGNWETDCSGLAKDFNLMTNPKCSGNIEHKFLSENEQFFFEIGNQAINEFYHFYLFKGELLSSNQNQSLKENDSFVLWKESKFLLKWTSIKDSHLIISKVVL